MVSSFLGGPNNLQEMEISCHEHHQYDSNQYPQLVHYKTTDSRLTQYCCVVVGVDAVLTSIVLETMWCIASSLNVLNVDFDSVINIICVIINTTNQIVFVVVVISYCY